MLHLGRANVSKDDLRSKLAELYKADKKLVSVFGFRTQFGGGKSTGFALIYDTYEALKRFEPHYRLVRIGEAQKIEKPSRQQRMWSCHFFFSCPISLFSFLKLCAGRGRGRGRRDEREEKHKGGKDHFLFF